jgi:hypothetical protein
MLSIYVPIGVEALTFSVTYPELAVDVSSVIPDELDGETVTFVKVFPVFPERVRITVEAARPNDVLITVALFESMRIGPETVSVTT